MSGYPSARIEHTYGFQPIVLGTALRPVEERIGGFVPIENQGWAMHGVSTILFIGSGKAYSLSSETASRNSLKTSSHMLQISE